MANIILINDIKTIDCQFNRFIRSLYYHLISMKQFYVVNFLATLFLLQRTICQACTAPQKGLYMSYNAMSKMDTLPNMFKEVNTKIPTFNSTWKKQQINYSIIDLRAEMHYNEYYQVQTFGTNYTINVTLGKIWMDYKFGYEITQASGKKSGWAYGKVDVDNSSFVKRIILRDGALEWDPEQVHDLLISKNLSIEHSQPKLEVNSLEQFEYILTHQLKQPILSQINLNYKAELKKHLNNEHVTNNATIIYKYKNYSFNFINVIKNYSIYFNKIKGLQVLFFFQLENKTTNCTPDNIDFSEDNLGGLQQIYSMTSLKSVFNDALGSGLFDVTIDNQWQVPAFQFYMGDLTASIPESKSYPSEDPLIVTCKFDNSKNSTLSSFSESQIYVEASQKCNLIYKQKQLIQIDLLIYFVVKIIAEDENLVFRISKSGLYSLKYKSIDPKFKVLNENLFKFHIESVLKGLNGRQVLGTGWQTIKRKFPGVFIPNQEYLIVFDASQA